MGVILKDKSCFFSICIPAYNAENYIEECVNSLFNQSFQDWEAIIIDDGSADKTFEIARRFVERNPERVSVTHTPNQGPYLARRVAFAQAKGKYILCLDADDALFNQNVLSKIHGQLVRHNLDLLLFNGGAHENARYSFVDYSALVVDEEGIVDVGSFLRTLATSYSLNNLAFKAFKRDLLVDAPSSQCRVQMAEDRLQVVQIASNIKRIGLLNQNLYYYRPSQGSTTHSVFLYEYFAQLCYVESIVHSHLDEWGVEDKEWRGLALKAVFGALRQIRETVFPKQERVALYKSIAESSFVDTVLSQQPYPDLRLDISMSIELLNRRRFAQLDWALFIAVGLKKIASR